MEHKTLKYLRLFIPGFIIILCLLPILLYIKQSAEIIKSYQTIFLGVYPIIAIVLGVFYHIFNFRDKLWESALNKIHSFIKQEMIRPFASEKDLFTKINGIKDTDSFLNIHYYLIDNNESLKRKTEQIYFNGSLLTTMIDLIIIISFFDLVYAVLTLFNWYDYYLSLIFISSIVIAISIWGKNRLLNRHLNLVKKQIAFYEQIDLEKLKDKLKEL